MAFEPTIEMEKDSSIVKVNVSDAEAWEKQGWKKKGKATQKPKKKDAPAGATEPDLKVKAGKGKKKSK